MGASIGFWEGHRAEGVMPVDEPGACGHELWAAEPPEGAYRALLGVRRPEAAPGWAILHGRGRGRDIPAGAIAGPYGPAIVPRDPWDALPAVTPAFRGGGTR
ncbi:hypothetical protein [Streptosporangium subroseum]|uniref:hypothetical protein n=1 Tax=Streptosporangium subroseum TaxID=106412 RepID=UPI00308D4E62|nr:hypothetical protein OHB15_50235 [Streptosporangium subroseum]